MNDKQISMIKLALAAKGVPSDLADVAVETLMESRAAMNAYTQRAQAEAMRDYVETALMLAEIPGYRPLADRLLQAVAAMVGGPAVDDAKHEE